MASKMHDGADLVVDVDALDRIGPGPHRVERELSVEWMRAALRKTDARVEEPSRLDLELMIQGDGRLLLRGSLLGIYTVPCARCLVDSPVSANTEICASYLPAETMRRYLEEAGAQIGDPQDPEGGTELESGDLDEFVYDAPALDLGALATELLVVAYPMRVLCSYGEDCQGLCPACGAVRNGSPADAPCPSCGDHGESGDSLESPWKAKLRELQGDG